MKYEPLYKIYRKSEQDWTQRYNERFNNEFTVHLDIEIKEYNRKNSYQAFYCIPPEATNLLLSIQNETATLLEQLRPLPNVMINHLMNSFLIDEIKASNDIEGIHSSRKEIKASLENLNKNKPKRFQSIVEKYKNILQMPNSKITINNSKELRTFYDAFLGREIADEDLPDGNIFRADSVDVKTRTDKVIHQGLYPETKIIDTMEKALAILNDTGTLLPIRVALFHYFFGYIHPFYDGNGRTSRIISSHYLTEELHPLIGLRLSKVIKANQKKYYDAFIITNSEYNCGDLTFFIIEFLSLLQATIKNTKDLLFKRVNRLKEAEKKLDVFLAKNNVTDQVILDIYFIALQASMFSLSSGATKEEIAKAIGKSMRTLDTKLKSIPADHLIITKIGKVLHFKLNTKILE